MVVKSSETVDLCGRRRRYAGRRQKLVVLWQEICKEIVLLMPCQVSEAWVNKVYVVIATDCFR